LNWLALSSRLQRPQSRRHNSFSPSFRQHLKKKLSKDAHSKLQTATFYFYVLRDFRKTIGKIDEIGGLRKQPVDPDYYSGLSLKGQALIETNDLQEVVQVLDGMQAMTEAPQARLPYGDEINFLCGWRASG
jgi:hypothetical protein